MRLTNSVGGVSDELEAGSGRVLLGPRDHPVRSVRDEVDNVDDLAALSIDVCVEPALVVLDLDDVGESGMIGVLENVFGLDWPAVVLYDSGQWLFNQT